MDDVAFGREGLHPQLERDTTPTAPPAPTGTSNTTSGLGFNGTGSTGTGSTATGGSTGNSNSYTPNPSGPPAPTNPLPPPSTTAGTLLNQLNGFEQAAAENGEEREPGDLSPPEQDKIQIAVYGQ